MLIATNPDPDSRLRFLLRVPLGSGRVFSDTWPRTKALYCHPLPEDRWLDDPEIIEAVTLRSCLQRGAAIDVMATRSRESRSQLVFTTDRGHDVVFWQGPRTTKQSQPGVRTPTARAAASPNCRSSSTPTNATAMTSPARR